MLGGVEKMDALQISPATNGYTAQMPKNSLSASALTSKWLLKGRFRALWSSSVPFVDRVRQVLNTKANEAALVFLVNDKIAGPVTCFEAADSFFQALGPRAPRVLRLKNFFGRLSNDLCCRALLRIGALGQVPTFAFKSEAALDDSEPACWLGREEWRGYGNGFKRRF
jgi:hypothetical protein